MTTRAKSDATATDTFAELNKNSIIGVKEAKKLLGSKSDNLSDKEVEQVITQLDFLAGLAIKSFLAKREEADM